VLSATAAVLLLIARPSFSVDATKSYYRSTKAFPRNDEISVNLTFNGPANAMPTVPGASGAGAAFSGYNYNGYGRGAVLVDVPLGWRVTVRCVNDVATVPHSCAIIRDAGDQTAPVFPGAATPDPQRGLPPGHSAEFSFVASRPGGYRIACLIPYDETMGMWDAFEITRTQRPSIREVIFYGGR